MCLKLQKEARGMKMTPANRTICFFSLSFCQGNRGGIKEVPSKELVTNLPEQVRSVH